MTSTTTTSTILRTPQGRSWWGWGWEKEVKIEPSFIYKPLKINEIHIRSPRVNINSFPPLLRVILSDDKFERLYHSRGKSFEDIMSNVQGNINNPTDLVAFPGNEHELIDLFHFCEKKNISCIIFGGGTSVVGAIDPTTSNDYIGTITISMNNFNKLLEVDFKSMSVLVEGGMKGPDLEEELKKYNLTLRHYPQSFEFSTVGGWVATRAGGHFATHHTHIDSLVQAVRICTPRGINQTRRLPASGAGPDENSHYIGSEGIYGAITQVWIRVRPRPTHRAAATIYFQDTNAENAFLKGAECVRDIVQSGLLPSNLRLIDGNEIQMQVGPKSGVSLHNTSVLLIGFESHQHNLDNNMKNALEYCIKHGGKSDAYTLEKWDRQTETGERDGLMGGWASSFMKAAYSRDKLCCLGMISETFETAITWDKFKKFHNSVLHTTKNALKNVCGGGNVTFRFTHIYTDGPAVYYTVIAPGKRGEEVEQWKKVKKAVLDTIIKEGGTCTHHHAVGKMHAHAFEQERGVMFGKVISSIKNVHDPKHILSPGVLICDNHNAKL